MYGSHLRLIVLCAIALSISCAAPTESTDEQRRFARLSPPPAGFEIVDRLEFESLQVALRHGQLDFAARHDVELPAETARLVEALRQVREGKNEEALASFATLAGGSSDEAMRGLAGSLYARLLYERGDYEELLPMLGDSEDSGSRLVTALASLPGQTVEPAGTVGDRLEVGPRGHASVLVEANGTSGMWVVDTGASYTVLSRSAAESLGVEPVDESPVEIPTATAKTRPARIGVISELRIGEVSAKNVAALVFDDADLTFELPNGETIEMNGIVGWPVLRELRIDLDYAGGRYTAAISTPRESPWRNYSWLGYPIVSLASDDGQPLLFGLDTGSWNTSIVEGILEKVDLGTPRDETVEIGGVGGYETTDVKVVDRLGLVIGNRRVVIDEVRTETESGANDVVFFATDGVLGSDIVQSGGLVLDYLNGHFAVYGSD